MNDKVAAILEINTETDFAAKNKIFLDFVHEIGRYALNVNDSFNFTLDDFLKQSIGGKKISEYFTNIIRIYINSINNMFFSMLSFCYLCRITHINIYN